MSSAAPGLEPGSFRDPAGTLFTYRGRILRVVNASGMQDLNAALVSPALKKSIGAGRVVGTELLSEAKAADLLRDDEVRTRFAAAGGEIVLEHERIPFPSYPYEWAPEMLHAAGVLTLDLASELLEDGLGLKDGTPYNVLFRGPEPVFIDMLSFERRDPGCPTWLPYAQFVRTFLLPLLVNKKFGVDLDFVLTTRRDGLEPEEVYRWAGSLQRLAPGFLGLVTMPTWLGRRNRDDQSLYRQKPGTDPEKALFILRMLLKRLRRTLDRLTPAVQTSTWSDYTTSNNYAAEHAEAKLQFTREALREFAPASVLDVGCNTGVFSALAAKAGARVVAIDYDPVVVGQAWRRARSEGLNILPLAVNLTRPTPGTGWRNRECLSFLDRARGSFDAVLMLAVIHHMLVTERVPLGEIVDLAAELTRDVLIIEFVAPEDSMFQRLTRGRERLHAGLTASVFETTVKSRFEIVRSQHLEGTHRWLYLLRRRAN